MRLFTSRRQKTQNEPLQTYDLGGMQIQLQLRNNPQTRRISLKLNRRGDGVILVYPRHKDRALALAFLAQKKDWIRQKLTAMRPAINFEPGALIPYGGRNYRIAQDKSRRFGVIFDNDHGLIQVAGPLEHLARRLRDAIKKQARLEISDKAYEMARKLGRKPGRITIRDQKTRWGSCAVSGNLSFSWRLMLAPPHILDYVVAHEVAHLLEMNHSPAFWNTVDLLVDNVSDCRRWLNENGADLHRIG